MFSKFSHYSVRFEHSSRLHKKITTRVDFPEIVDMSPYISHARWKNEFVPYLSLLLHLDFPPNNCILNLLCIEMGKLDLAQITWWQNPTTGIRQIVENFHTRNFNRNLSKGFSYLELHSRSFNIRVFISWIFQNFTHGGSTLSFPVSRYVLFAVINHIGTLDAGHYTSYIRFMQCHNNRLFIVFLKRKKLVNLQAARQPLVPLQWSPNLTS